MRSRWGFVAVGAVVFGGSGAAGGGTGVADSRIANRQPFRMSQKGGFPRLVPGLEPDFRLGQKEGLSSCRRRSALLHQGAVTALIVPLAVSACSSPTKL